MARIHLLRLTGQRKCPSFRNPLKALLTQPCGFTFLAYWLSSPEKMFSPAGSILHKLFSPPYFSQPPEAVSVGRGLQRDKAKVAGGIQASRSTCSATHSPRYQDRCMPHWTKGNSVSISPGCCPSLLPAMLLRQSLPAVGNAAGGPGNAGSMNLPFPSSPNGPPTSETRSL